MSFILDALKRSEEERRQGTTPDLHTEPVAFSASRRRRWPLLVFLALLLNAGILVYFLHPWRKPVPSAPSAPPAVPVSPSPVPAPEAIPTLVSLPAPPAVLQPAPAPAGWDDLPASPAAAVSSAARRGGDGDAIGRSPAPVAKVGKAEPPASRSTDLPELKISLHYFTDDSASRLVRINGRIFREGEEVAPGLLLEAITPSGIVLQRGDERFRLGEF